MRFFLYLLIIPILSSCNIINPKEDIPAYIKIDSVGMQPWFNNFQDHNITDLWVYRGGEFLGVYPVPALIPVYGEGKTNLTFNAGIYSDGLRNLRLSYAFYKPVEVQFDFVPGIQVDTTMRFATVDLPQNRMPPDGSLFEDFENSTFGMQRLKINDTATFDFKFDSTEFRYPKGGVYSGVAISKPGNLRVLEISDILTRALPKGGFVFLEFTYLSNIEMRVGFYATTSQGTFFVYDLVLFPTSGWRKIYVNLSDEVQSVQSSNSIRVTWQALVAEGSARSYIALDNVRLLY